MSSSSDASARARVHHEHDVHASLHVLPELRTFASTFDVRRVGIPEDLLDEALQAARVEGYDAGRAEAFEAAELELRERRAAQQESIDDARHALETATTGMIAMQSSLDARLADRVGDVAFAVAEALVGRELATATDPGRDAIARALALAPARVAVTVRLHPDDLGHGGGLGGDEAGRNLSLVGDPTLSRGDSVVELDTGEIDASIGAALERVRRALEGES